MAWKTWSFASWNFEVHAKYLILVSQARGAFSSPYTAHLNFHTCNSLSKVSNLYGFSIYMSSLITLLRNVVFTSIWWIFHPIYADTPRIDLMDEYLSTGAKVSSSSITST